MAHRTLRAAQRRLESLAAWLSSHESLLHSVQTLGVVVAIIFGLVQLRETRIAAEQTAQANRIALSGRISDIIIRINEAAISNPDASPGYSPIQRLHLIRLEYFFQTFKLRQAGIMDDDRFEAETRYLAWAGEQPEFEDIWATFRDQYPTPFRDWVDSTLRNA